MPFNPRNVLVYLNKEFIKYTNESLISFEEWKVAEDMKNTLLQALEEKDADFEVEYELDEHDYEEDDYPETEPESEQSGLESDLEGDDDVFKQQEPQTSSQCPYEPSPRKQPRQSDVAKIKAAYDYMYDTKTGKPRKWSSVQQQHKSVSKDQVYRFKKNIEKGGTTRDKFKIIRDKVYQKFCDGKDKKLIMHDDDLVRWALNANRNLDHPVDGFKASSMWLLMFKKKYRICHPVYWESDLNIEIPVIFYSFRDFQRYAMFLSGCFVLCFMIAFKISTREFSRISTQKIGFITMTIK